MKWNRYKRWKLELNALVDICEWDEIKFIFYVKDKNKQDIINKKNISMFINKK